jgi:multicomponent Na+:H+ antiporter subunit A
VVSAIIVDFRALDTVGEITVLFVAAVGVASLVLAAPFDRRRRRPRGPETVSRASELLLPHRDPVPAESEGER